MKLIADYLLGKKKQLDKVPNPYDVELIVGKFLPSTSKVTISIKQETVTIKGSFAVKSELMVRREEIKNKIMLRYPQLKNIRF